ncbi:MAG: DNA primase [Hellea sp.]|nr:DNA primase [Hellea sp.]
MDELKTRVRPSDVIGRHVKLKRQGREFAGLSPFTNEKTPSFFVNDDKGFYHCFSSGKHGDVISFLMEVEGLSFPEAVEKLASEAGMEMPKVDPDAERRAARNKVAINWMDAAHTFFMKSLRRDVGSEARDYLKSRGLTGEDAQRFGIGFAPDSFDALRDELVQQGASHNVLIEAGLIIEPDDKSREPWDRFRNRIMFPIHDTRGRLVAFGGRAMERDAKAKYLNSPETNIFHKGRILYRYPEARRSLSDPKNPSRGLIVAEGYMDVIALAKYGFEHAVAPLGTALTEDQLDLLWRAGPEPILCFDGDKAGLRAAFRSIERALPMLRPSQSLRFAILPNGQDPDDLLRSDGRAAMTSVLERAMPLVDMLWQREVQAAPLNTPEDKAGLKDRIYAALREINHDSVRDLYKTRLLERFYAEFGYKSRGGFARRKPQKFLSSDQKGAMNASAIMATREQRLLGAILEWPELLDHVDDSLFAFNFTQPGLSTLLTAILSYQRTTNKVEKSELYSHIEREGLGVTLKSLKKDRRLTMAAMGGSDANLENRLALWNAEAEALLGNVQVDDAREDARSRMADSIREDNAEGLKKLMRASRRKRQS